MANLKDPNQPVTVTTALDPTSGTTIPTSGGTLSVRPYRSSSTSKLKALVTFTPRASGLDRSNVKAASDEFRGFYSLFWIGLALLFVRTSYDSWETNRTILSGTFGRLISTDVLVLALSDAIMVGSMFVCVPFVKGLVNGWYGYYWVGAALQHAWQCVFLGMAIWWGFHRQWYWVQSGFLVLRKSRIPKISLLFHSNVTD
jgi:sterol O-acyltransferase